MKIEGIGAAPGLAIGPVVLLSDSPRAPRRTLAPGEAAAEEHRLSGAIARVRAELAELQARLPADLAEILGAQLLFLEDPELLSEVSRQIAAGQNAEWAVETAANEAADVLAALDDPYLRERAADVRDLGQRLVAMLAGRHSPQVRLTAPAILVARDLTPSDTAQLDRALVLGFVTELGGPTSHSAIMARSLGIPALVGATGAINAVRQGQTVVLDATGNELLVDLTPDVLAHFERQLGQHAERLREQQARTDLPAVTTDGHRVELAANIGGLEDVASALDWGAEGVGLFRTEFLYMHSDHLPTEEEQYDAYAQVVQAMAPRPVIIRTLDIGGDKALPYMGLPQEENPFLGCRALRLCLARPDLFKTQLRAILRAGIHGMVRIMFPMVATRSELLQAKALLTEAASELAAAGVPHESTPEVGIMIEVPSAALMCETLARDVDFFSIGSNDLIQYTLAADRGNKSVAYLYDCLQPAVLQLVARVIAAAHQAGKWVGVCGEMAGDPDAIPILLGLGLDEFSMSASALPHARDQIRQLCHADCRHLAELTLACADTREVRALLREGRRLLGG